MVRIKAWGSVEPQERPVPVPAPVFAGLPPVPVEVLSKRSPKAPYKWSEPLESADELAEPLEPADEWPESLEPAVAAPPGEWFSRPQSPAVADGGYNYYLDK